MPASWWRWLEPASPGHSLLPMGVAFLGLSTFLPAGLVGRASPWFWVLTILLVLLSVYCLASAGVGFWLSRRQVPPRRARPD